MTSCQLPGRMKPFRKGVFSYRKEFAPTGANSFLLELIPSEKGKKNENGRVASPGSLSNQVKVDNAVPLIQLTFIGRAFRTRLTK